MSDLTFFAFNCFLKVIIILLGPESKRKRKERMRGQKIQ